MAVTRTVSNKWKYEMGLGSVDISSDTFKVILMESAFVYDQDTHGLYSDVSGSEITDTGGYTVGGETLTAATAWAQDNTNDRARVSWQDKTFTAGTAAFDTFCAACILDTTHASSVVVGCIEFGEDIDVSAGNSFQLQDLAYNKG